MPRVPRMINVELVRHEIQSRLPPRTRWIINSISCGFDFSLARKELKPIASSDLNFGPLEYEWKELFLFGEQSVANGGGSQPFIAVDRSTGAICGIDVERDKEIFLLNSDIEAFIQSFLFLDEAFRSHSPDQETLSAALRLIDPATFDTSEWRLLLEALA